MRAGRAVVAAAFDGDSIAVCSGQHNPIEQTTEIVGVGTLPSVRRQGYAAAVTSALVADAQARGIETIFLSAGDEDVARIYARIGFRPIGTAIIAEATDNPLAAQRETDYQVSRTTSCSAPAAWPGWASTRGLRRRDVVVGLNVIRPSRTGTGSGASDQMSSISARKTSRLSV